MLKKANKKFNFVSVKYRRNDERNGLSEQPGQEESNETQSEVTTSAQPDPTAPPMLVQESSRPVFTIPFSTLGSPSDPPPPYQSPQSFGESPPNYQAAAAATGGFREENYKTDYGSAFTYS